MKLNSRKLWYESGHSEQGGMIPHQVCQVGLVSTHELPLLANGSNPVVNRFVEILPDILLQVVPTQKEKYKSSFKKYTGGVRKNPPMESTHAEDIKRFLVCILPTLQPFCD